LITQTQSKLDTRVYLTSAGIAIAALELIAQSIDTREHSALARRDVMVFLTAIREPENFVGGYSMVDGEAIKRMVRAHSTEVLKLCNSSNLTGLAAADGAFDNHHVRRDYAATLQIAGLSGRSPIAQFHNTTFDTMPAQMSSRISGDTVQAKMAIMEPAIAFPGTTKPRRRDFRSIPRAVRGDQPRDGRTTGNSKSTADAKGITPRGSASNSEYLASWALSPRTCQWTPRLLFRVLRGIVIAALTITCACLAGGMADGQQPRRIATAAPYLAITDGTQLQTDDCSYRNIPGGYLHQGHCQPSWTAPGL